MEAEIREKMNYWIFILGFLVGTLNQILFFYVVKFLI